MNNRIIILIAGFVLWFLVCLVGDLIDDLILKRLILARPGGGDFLFVKEVRFASVARLKMHLLRAAMNGLIWPISVAWTLLDWVTGKRGKKRRRFLDKLFHEVQEFHLELKGRRA